MADAATGPTRGAEPALILCHRLDLDGGDATAADRALLDAWERHRADAFRSSRDRRRYLLAHTALRRLLGEHLGLPPTSLEVTRSPTGKPALCLKGPPCHFSLTHAGGTGWLAIAPVAVGIDAEALSIVDPLSSLIAASCTPAETRALLALDAPRRGPAFLAAWTRKEAVLKAWGSGLGEMDPAGLQVGLDGPGPVLAAGHEPLSVTTVTAGDQVVSVAAAQRPGFRLCFERWPQRHQGDFAPATSGISA